ncbi:MAG: hypothetical protein R6V83_02150 [Candidatus Thorarchaeota archaeon]
MLRKVVCPVCSKSLEVKVTKDMIKDEERFPVTVRIEHGQHYFYVNLDSKAAITDILHPDLVQ